MTKEDLVQKDKSFNSELFITKANNIIKKIYQAITKDELEKINHFISDNVYNSLEKQIDNVKSKNCSITYDDISVNTSLYNIEEDTNEYIIYTDVEINCIKYIKDKESNTIVGGDVNNKITIDKIAIFKKKKILTSTITNRCRGCGKTYNIVNNGICPTCGRVYDLEEEDYYLDELR